MREVNKIGPYQRPMQSNTVHPLFHGRGEVKKFYDRHRLSANITHCPAEDWKYAACVSRNNAARLEEIPISSSKTTVAWPVIGFRWESMGNILWEKFLMVLQGIIGQRLYSINRSTQPRLPPPRLRWRRAWLKIWPWEQMSDQIAQSLNT